MTDFAMSWDLCRSRLRDTVSDLNHAQINWRIYPESLTIAEMVIHVAGVELWFVQQLTGQTYGTNFDRVVLAATAGVVNNEPFPFTAEELTPSFMLGTLDFAREIVQPHIENPSEDFLANEIKSALGPMISGRGALARFAFHPGYHQGQAYLIRSAPNFPS